MRVFANVVLSVLVITASAAPTMDEVIPPICDSNKKVWSTGNVFKTSPVSRINDAPGADVDTIYGIPKNIPKSFVANSKMGPPGALGGSFKESDHFRVYGAKSDAQAAKTLVMMEAAYDCFVNDLKHRTSGLSYNAKTDDGYSGPFYKENIFGRPSMGAAGVMNTDMKAGFSYLQVLVPSLDDPGVTVHEYGHALTYHEKGWVDQERTGTWWEPVANWYADTYMSSDLCAAARKRGGNLSYPGRTLIRLDVVISRAHQVIVDGSQGTGNYYESWPFITYITNNPDNIDGLGKFALRNMFRKYKKGTNETPLHAMSYITKTPVREILGKYWARMAFMDIGHPVAKELWEKTRPKLNYANLDGAGGSYRPKAARTPKYFGANIIPLKVTGGTVDVKITAAKPFIATLAVRPRGGKVTYTECPQGACTAKVGPGEEAMLTIVNAPKELIMYNGFKLAGSPVLEGLNYDLKLTGASA